MDVPWRKLEGGPAAGRVFLGPLRLLYIIHVQVLHLSMRNLVSKEMLAASTLAHSLWSCPSSGASYFLTLVERLLQMPVAEPENPARLLRLLFYFTIVPRKAKTKWEASEG